MHKNVIGQDLTKESPRSPRIRVGGYAILGRTIDKCRALVAGNVGEYHFDCPLDNTLFGFKSVKGVDFKAQIENGASDQQMAEWLDQAGERKTPDEIRRWSDEATAASLYNHPEKRDWFAEECKKLGLDPARTTTFEWLETDDKASHQPAT
jgi:GH18 family chitinase